jgi:hypothetical protein
MKLIDTSPSAVFASLKARKNPRSQYCRTINGYILGGDFVCMDAASNVEVLNIDADTSCVRTQMLKHFKVSVTVGEVTKIYKPQGLARLPGD